MEARRNILDIEDRDERLTQIAIDAIEARAFESLRAENARLRRLVAEFASALRASGDGEEGAYKRLVLAGGHLMDEWEASACASVPAESSTGG